MKVRGYRIEPGEVEAVLAADPGVRSAVVRVWDQRLVAYLVPADPAVGIPALDRLREYARRLLPEYMLPATFVELAALPLTPNGKPDRAALPAPEATASDGYIPPVGATEELLAGIWMQLLGVDQIGATDNFFELGGHSLLATQVVSRVRDVFGTETPLAALFDHPTIRGLAEVIDGTTAAVPAAPVVPVPRDRALPLSFGQQRLWFLGQLDAGATDYNLPLPPFRFGGALDVAALTAALGAFVARHEVLRTRLVTGPDGVPYQVIDPPAPVPLPVVDLAGRDDAVEVAERLVALDAAVPFDLARGPVVRAVLIRLAPDEHALALTLHHVVFDEWSGRILRHELTALYEAFRAGEPDPLPPLGVQYADFAVWQRARLSGEVLEAELDHWRRRLAGLSTIDLPADRPRPPVRSSEGAVLKFAVAPEVSAALRSLARQRGATMSMTLLAACFTVLSRYCGTEDVVIGTPVAGRNRAETEDLIGFFVNTLVMRADLSGDPTFAELLDRVRRTALDAYAHQDLPFEQLVDALVTDRDRSRTPLFQALFDYYGQTDPGGPPTDLGDEVQAGVNAKFDLRLIFADDGDSLAGAIEYSTALFDATTVRRMIGHLVTVLIAAAGEPERALSTVPMLPPAEHDQLVRAWNDTAAELPDVSGVHELIAARARIAPDAVAVVSGDRSLTYGALLDRAGRLARYLRDAGVGAETVVGLCLPRGADMAVAVLAVWQAEGAYLPLDPDYPAERLGFMLADIRAAVVIGTEDLVADLPVGRAIVVTLDDPYVEIALAATQPLPADAGPAPLDRLAYVIYTSGSTGRPKGVQVTHGGLLNYVTWAVGAYGVTAAAGAPLHTSLSFDLTVTSLLPPLVAGAPVVVSGDGGAEGLASVARTAGGFGLTKVVPAHLPLLREMLEPATLAGLTARLVVGGEALPGSYVRAWLADAPESVVVNEYGPTETVVGCCVFEVTAGQPVPESVPIGTPIANTTLFVLDPLLRPVPIGVPGELYVGGAGVARGYGGRAAL
ncbi:AMP-binding protein, partial [Micromonospora sp. CPCC 205371]|nr:AMP-binding protein [Micromonospora sp. CPCC 205371]